MKMKHHYTRLREYFPHIADSQELEITLDELAAILDCTHRNVVLILKRMAANQWLQWSPKRGRSNRSVLIFLLRNEEMSLQIAQELVAKKDLRGALEQINGTAMPASIKQNFNEWLYSYFGYSSELKDLKKIDTLRFPLNQPFYTLDPLHINFAGESHLVNQIFDSLVHYNSVSRTIEPSLAHAWETDSSRTKWTFYLRKGVLFHDGKEMTSQDVLYSFNRLRSSNVRMLYRWAYDAMERIEAPDPTTVQITLRERNELFLPFLSTSRASIVPMHICEESADRFGKAPIGTGPFKLVKNDGSICLLEAFPYYFQGRAHLDQVEIWNIPDLYDQEHQRGMENFQLIHNFRLTEASAEKWNQVRQMGTTCKFIRFNSLKQGPLARPELRRAICDTFDRGKLIEALAGDVIYPTDGFISKKIPYIGTVDREQAKSRLEQAGYSGEVLELCTIPQYERDALLFQAIGKQMGLEVEISLIPMEDFKGEQRLKADLILFAVMLDNDAELRLVDLYKTMQQQLEPQLQSELKQLLDTILAEPSAMARTDLLNDIEQLLKTNHSLLFLYQKHLKTIFHPSVKGISMDSLGWVRFKDLWFKP